METLIAIAIVAILMGVALPSVRESLVRTNITQTANDLVLDFNTARAEAVKRGFNTAVIAKTGGWAAGWDIRVDINGNGIYTDGLDVLVREHPAIQPPYTVLGAPVSGGAATQVVYNGTGSTTGGAYDLVVCREQRDAQLNRGVQVERNGTISTRRKTTGLVVSCP